MIGAVAELRHHTFIAHGAGAGQFQDKVEWVSGPPLPGAPGTVKIYENDC